MIKTWQHSQTQVELPRDCSELAFFYCSGWCLRQSGTHPHTLPGLHCSRLEADTTHIYTYTQRSGCSGEWSASSRFLLSQLSEQKRVHWCCTRQCECQQRDTESRWVLIFGFGGFLRIFLSNHQSKVKMWHLLQRCFTVSHCWTMAVYFRRDTSVMFIRHVIVPWK